MTKKLKFFAHFAALDCFRWCEVFQIQEKIRKTKLYQSLLNEVRQKFWFVFCLNLQQSEKLTTEDIRFQSNKSIGSRSLTFEFNDLSEI